MSYLKKQDLIDNLKEKDVDGNIQDMSREELLKLYEEHNTVPKKTWDEIPKITDPDWTEFILDQMIDGVEIHDRIPTCDGLRRMFELYIGEITSSTVEVIKAPTISDNCACVKFSVCYFVNGEDGAVFTKSISDVMDVNKENTPYPWCLASSATAATKAEARALRKGLRLIKVFSKEEVAQGFDEAGNDDVDDSVRLAGDSIKRAVKNMANQISVDITKVLRVLEIEKNLDSCTQLEAQLLLKELNGYRANNSVPDEVKADLSIM